MNCILCKKPLIEDNGFTPMENITYVWCTNEDCNFYERQVPKDEYPVCKCEELERTIARQSKMLRLCSKNWKSMWGQIRELREDNDKLEEKLNTLVCPVEKGYCDQMERLQKQNAELMKALEWALKIAKEKGQCDTCEHDNDKSEQGKSVCYNCNPFISDLPYWKLVKQALSEGKEGEK